MMTKNERSKQLDLEFARDILTDIRGERPQCATLPPLRENPFLMLEIVKSLDTENLSKDTILTRDVFGRSANEIHLLQVAAFVSCAPQHFIRNVEA